GRENGYAYASNDPINHHDPSGHMDIPKEELVPEGRLKEWNSTGRLGRLNMQKEIKFKNTKIQVHKPIPLDSYRFSSDSPAYSDVRKRLSEAGLSAPVVPASRLYLDALLEAKVRAKKRPNDRQRSETAHLLEALYYHAKGGESSDYKEAAGYDTKHLLGQGGLTRIELATLRTEARRAFDKDSRSTHSLIAGESTPRNYSTAGISGLSGATEFHDVPL
ncbi:MAG: hypothetical protein JAZ02_19405, partial [Candidatus Thiodiazotropha endolucinida]|nr:hypothetical protein [Candidatus Thiodiazotropha endolucinida]